MAASNQFGVTVSRVSQMITEVTIGAGTDPTESAVEDLLDGFAGLLCLSIGLHHGDPAAITAGTNPNLYAACALALAGKVAAVYLLDVDEADSAKIAHWNALWDGLLAMLERKPATSLYEGGNSFVPSAATRTEIETAESDRGRTATNWDNWGN